MDTSRISPTAHYTGYTWYAYGLSHQALVTAQGERLFDALKSFNSLYKKARPADANLVEMLLQRHLVMDHLLTQAIVSGEVSQVIEIAAGLSPRGNRFARRFPDLLYVESDLPDMAAHKSRLLEDAGLTLSNHRILTVNALESTGEDSLARVGERSLDFSKGVAIITEGLINYFDLDAVQGMWRRFGAFLGRFPAGLYLSDLHTREDVGHDLVSRVFQIGLSIFARGQVFLHFDDRVQARTALHGAGFSKVALAAPQAFAPDVNLPARTGKTLMRIVQARV